MNRLKTTMVLAASLLATEAMYAAPIAFHVPVHAMFGKEKTVKLNLRNNTKQPLKVMAGQTELVLEPGKPVAVKLRAGDKVVAEEASASFASGAVLAIASSQIDDATVLIN